MTPQNQICANCGHNEGFHKWKGHKRKNCRKEGCPCKKFVAQPNTDNLSWKGIKIGRGQTQADALRGCNSQYCYENGGKYLCPSCQARMQEKKV